jgi:hypothetical protein
MRKENQRRKNSRNYDPDEILTSFFNLILKISPFLALPCPKTPQFYRLCDSDPSSRNKTN